MPTLQEKLDRVANLEGDLFMTQVIDKGNNTRIGLYLSMINKDKFLYWITAIEADFLSKQGVVLR
jgi:hypothetical protein